MNNRAIPHGPAVMRAAGSRRHPGPARTGGYRAIPLLALAAWGYAAATPAMADPPPPVLSLLLQEGDLPLASPGAATVTAIRTTRATGPGGFAAMVELGGGIDAIWGSAAGVVDPQILVAEHTISAGGQVLFEQVRFEPAFGYTSLGQVAYSAFLPVGTCSPAYRGPGYLDSVWVGDTLLALDGNPARLAPAMQYVLASAPGLTSLGNAYWHGGAASAAQSLPEWEALFFERSGNPLPWVQSGLPIAGGTLQKIGPFAVSTLGSYAICAARLQSGDEVLVRAEWDEDGFPLVAPAILGGTVRPGRTLSAIGAETGEKWGDLLHVGATDSAGPGTLPYWFVLAETITNGAKRHAVVMSNGMLNYVACRSGDEYSSGGVDGGRELLGRPEHVAINPQGDLATVWRVKVSGTEPPEHREALFLNGLRLVETGDAVPIRDASGSPISGVLTNILGVNTVSVSGRDPSSTVSVYFIGNVAPAAGSMERTAALFRVDQVVSSGTICSSDWNLDGQINSSDISAFLAAWLDDLADAPPTTLADFNGDGATNSVDISAFLTAWLAGVGGGC